MSNKNYALITGASSGIGSEIARQLAQKGYPLIITARRRERLEELALEIEDRWKVKVEVITADLGLETGARDLYDQVQARKLRVDILVNNAGFGIQGYFLDMDMAHIKQMNTLNINSLIELTQLFARQMKDNGGGYILQVASMVALALSPMVSAYAGSKAAVLAFSETIHYELKRHKISVTTLYPGITTTEFNEVAHAETPAMMKSSILSAAQVAKVGLRAMFRRKRSVVPGKINQLNAFFSKISPRGLIIDVAGSLMEKANKK
ncbi:MAG: SDR family oxidoreductase [Bacteroidia bacterium]|nr:SDR family oxidoreductase [Bacteroidia bacterium]